MIKIKKVKISLVKENPNNPRVIKDAKFEKLVKSAKEFPEMLELRPIIVDKDMIALGGNQRLKAYKEAGYKHVFIIDASHLSPEKQQEFILKDNIGYGEWDWDVLVKDFPSDKFEDWGLEKEIEGRIRTVNFEVNTDTFSNKFTLKFELSEKEYSFAMQKLNAMSDNKEKSLLKILGYAE